MTRLYIAGPDIFRPDARLIAERQKALCLRYGFTPLHPLDGDLVPAATVDSAMAIFRANQAKMHEADGIIANLTPFRGPSADPGTVFELGFMLALGRPAYAYSRTAVPFRQRTVAAGPGSALNRGTGRWSDAQGLEIEDFGLGDNLMIDCALLAGSSPLITPEPPGFEPPDGLQGFERGLERAHRHFGTQLG